jgi:hypothetical protein
MFRFGEAVGEIYGLLVGLNLPVSYVTPQQWQKHHGIGASSDAARQHAVQLYPELLRGWQRKESSTARTLFCLRTMHGWRFDRAGLGVPADRQPTRCRPTARRHR